MIPSAPATVANDRIREKEDRRASSDENPKWPRVAGETSPHRAGNENQPEERAEHREQARREQQIVGTTKKQGVNQGQIRSMEEWIIPVGQKSFAREQCTSVAQLTVTACLIGLALGQLIAGPLSDQFGRRRVLLTGVLAYVVTSALCAASPSIKALIATVRTICLPVISGATQASECAALTSSAPLSPKNDSVASFDWVASSFPVCWMFVGPDAHIDLKSNLSATDLHG